MARPLRVEYAGALHHITARGARRSVIFEDDTDRLFFYDIISGIIERLGWYCEAYCLMDNHYHLLVETPRPNLSAGMCRLNSAFAQRFNRRHGYVGPVFQGRFVSILVDSDAYRLELARYIVLNPVRAGMVSHPGAWRWSSYGATTNERARPRWLAVDRLLKNFSDDPNSARERYVRFVRDGLGLPGPWTDLSNQLFLGDEQFIAHALQRGSGSASECNEIPKIQRQAMVGTLDSYLLANPDRNTAMRSAYATGLFTLKQIAAHFGLHYSTVSRIVKKHTG